MQRKIQAILLLCIWVFQSIFPYVLLEYQKYECRKVFEHRRRDIPADQIVQFAFSKGDQIPCRAKDKEFIYHGKLYDILEYSKNDTAIFIKCVPDKKEDLVVLAHCKVLNGKGKRGSATYNKPCAPDLKCILSNEIAAPVCKAESRVLPVFTAHNYRFDFKRTNFNPPEVLS